jgi:hypothetical protein
MTEEEKTTDAKVFEDLLQTRRDTWVTLSNLEAVERGERVKLPPIPVRRKPSPFQKYCAVLVDEHALREKPINQRRKGHPESKLVGLCSIGPRPWGK